MKSLKIIIILAVYVAMAAARLRYPAVADEVDFMLPIEKWVAGGPQSAGLWHSPLYPWLLMILGKLFGYSVATARMIGVISILVSALLIWRAFVLVTKRDFASNESLITFAFALVSPLAIGSALLLDYDSTLLVFATSLFFCELVRLDLRGGSPRFIVLRFGFLTGVALLAKETTPLIFPLGLLVLLWRRGWGPMRSTLISTLSGLLGVAIFLAFVTAWCVFYKIPVRDVFAMDLLGLQVHGNAVATTNFMRQIWVKVSPMFWVGLPLVAVFIRFLPGFFKSDNASQVAIASVSVVVILVYTFVLRQMTYQFPKYMVPVLLWLPWLVMVDSRFTFDRKWFRWFVSGFLWFAVFPTTLEVLYARDVIGLTLTVTASLAPFLAIVFFARRQSYASLLVLLALGASISNARTAFFTDRSIHYWFGEQALVEVSEIAQKWREQAGAQGVIISPAKDLAYELRKYGAEYLSPDQISEQSAQLCARAQRQPLLIVTRIREDSSLGRAPQLGKIQNCLGSVRQGIDIAYVTSYR